jgi:hypothetical protein
MASTARPGHRQHVSDDRRKELADALGPAYVAGATIRHLAAEHGLSYGFVHRLLTVDCGLTLRTRGYAKAEVA